MNFLELHRHRVGLRVTAARKSTDLGQEAFAAKVGITRRHLSRIETGRHLPRPDLLARIAEATDKPESFFESSDDEEDRGMTLDEFLQSRIEMAVEKRFAERLKARA